MALKRKHGKGVLNKLINLLPIEAHIPGGYRYCGPGTKLEKRLARGDPPINGLDSACKDHDIAYSKTSDTKERNRADLELADKAWQRVTAGDSSLGERAAAYAVTNAMKLKAKMGMGARRRPHRGGCVKKKKKVGNAIRRKRKTTKGAGVKRKKTATKRRNRVVTRIIPVPKTGGNLESTLSRLGLTTSSIPPAVKKITTVLRRKKKKKTGTRIGKGLYLRPYRSGYGLYLKPWAPDLN
nr:PREDICTED: uncharacterized protein LOC109043466 [Bemisia tabaci]